MTDGYNKFGDNLIPNIDFSTTDYLLTHNDPSFCLIVFAPTNVILLNMIFRIP